MRLPAPPTLQYLVGAWSSNSLQATAWPAGDALSKPACARWHGALARMALSMPVDSVCSLEDADIDLPEASEAASGSPRKDVDSERVGPASSQRSASATTAGHGSPSAAASREDAADAGDIANHDHDEESKFGLPASAAPDDAEEASPDPLTARMETQRMLREAAEKDRIGQGFNPEIRPIANFLSRMQERAAAVQEEARKQRRPIVDIQEVMKLVDEDEDDIVVEEGEDGGGSLEGARVAPGGAQAAEEGGEEDESDEESILFNDDEDIVALDYDEAEDDEDEKRRRKRRAKKSLTAEAGSEEASGSEGGDDGAAKSDGAEVAEGVAATGDGPETPLVTFMRRKKATERDAAAAEVFAAPDGSGDGSQGAESEEESSDASGEEGEGPAGGVVEEGERDGPGEEASAEAIEAEKAGAALMALEAEMSEDEGHTDDGDDEDADDDGNLAELIDTKARERRWDAMVRDMVHGRLEEEEDQRRLEAVMRGVKTGWRARLLGRRERGLVGDDLGTDADARRRRAARAAAAMERGGDDRDADGADNAGPGVYGAAGSGWDAEEYTEEARRRSRLAARVPARDDTAASPVKAGSEVPLDEASKKILRFIQRAERPAAAAGPARASAASRGGDGALPGSESFSMAGLVGSEGSCFSFAPLLRDSQLSFLGKHAACPAGKRPRMTVDTDASNSRSFVFARVAAGSDASAGPPSAKSRPAEAPPAEPRPSFRGVTQSLAATTSTAQDPSPKPRTSGLLNLLGKCKADPADATKPRLPDTPFVLFGKGSSAAGVRPA